MSIQVSASTRVAAVIGDPVRHSMSPAIHNAGFAALGIDATYVALPVAAGDAANAVAAMRTLGLMGYSVTMPHKRAVMEACDELTDTAKMLGAVNCVFWNKDKIVGDSTDGDGFVRGLKADLGYSTQGQRCVIYGAGGAAGAVAYALAQAGASEVTVVNRTPDKAVAAAALAGSVGRVGSPDDLKTADLIVNATPLGMASTDVADLVPFDVSTLQDHAVVSDLIYHPAETALVAQARARGLAAQNGLPMLVHQAVAAFEHWTGVDAPVDAMTAAVKLAV